MTATVGKIKADLILATGQFKRDVDESKSDMKSLGVEIRERKNDFLLVESAARAQAEATKRAAAEAKKAAQEQAALAREARQTAQEATRNARELAEAAKQAAPEMKKAAEEQAAAAKQTAIEAKEAARAQSELARQARTASQEQNAIAREARQIASQARQAAREQAKAQDEAAKAAKYHKEALQEVGTVGGTVFATLAVGIGVLTMKSAEMQQQLQDLKSFTGAAADEVEKAKEAAEKFGPSNGILAPESVGVITEFNKAGVEMSRLLNGELKDAQSLMVAGELDVGEAAAHASYALNTYKDDLLSIKDVANAEAGAANASATSVREMGDAHRQLGPVAAQLNESFEDTNTLLAIFANNGLRGSDAGTSLKTALLQLAAPTAEQARVMDDLKLKFFTAEGQLKSYAEISEMLQNKLAKYNDQARTVILSTLAGTDGVRALSIMARSGAQEFNRMNTEIGKVSAAQVAETRLQSLNGQLKILQAEAGVAANRFGDDFLPAVQGAAGGVLSLVQAYNDLDPTVRSAINTVLLSATAMTGTATTLALSTVALGNLKKALEGVGGAMALLERHPIILALTLLAGAATAVYTIYQKNEEAARKFAAAQNELNDAIAKAATTAKADEYKGYQEKAKQIEELGKQYDGLIAKQQKTNASGITPGEYSLARFFNEDAKAAGELGDKISDVRAKLKELGIDADKWKESSDALGQSLRSNSHGLLEMTRSQVDMLATTQDSINNVNALQEEYNRLSAQESLNAEQKSRLSEVTGELSKAIPGLSIATDANGRSVIYNTGLIGDWINAKAKAIEADKALAKSQIENGIVAAQAEAKLLQQRLANLISYANAVNSLTSATVESGDDGDNKRSRNINFAEGEQGNVQAQLSAKKVDIAEMEAQLKRIQSGNFNTNIPKSGGSSYTIPDAPKSGGKDAEKEAERARQEAYQRELANAKRALDHGLITQVQYVDKLKEIRSSYSDWLAKNYSESYSLEDEIASNSFQSSRTWIEATKKAMLDKGATAEAVARFEIDAWGRVASRNIYLAQDQKQAQEELHRAEHDLAAATYQSTDSWIEQKEKSLDRAGASELEKARMAYDAWGRVNSRIGQGVYLLEDEKKATEALADATQRLQKAMADDLRKARELDRDHAIQTIEDERDTAVNAIQSQIDALEKQIEQEDYLLSLKKEQQKLAELEEQRANVASIKNQRRVEYVNGEAKLVWVADEAKLSDLDKQITEQKDRIADMQREHERSENRKNLEKQLKDTQDSYDKKLKAEQEYWKVLLSEERVNADMQAAIAKDGMDKTLTNIEIYLAKMQTLYSETQAKIMKNGGIEMPDVGPLPRASVDDVKAKMAENSKKWPTASPAEKERLHDENVRLGTSIGGKYDSKTGKWTFHTGVDSVPGPLGSDVPGVTLQAGERVFSISQNETFVRFMQMLMSLVSMPSPIDSKMRGLMTQFSSEPSGMSRVPMGGRAMIDTGGAPLIGQIVAAPGMDEEQLANMAADKVVRKFYETVDKL